MENAEGVEAALELDTSPARNTPTVFTARGTNLTDEGLAEEIKSIKMNLACVCCSVISVTSATTILSYFSPAFLLDDKLDTVLIILMVVIEVVSSFMLLPMLSKALGSRFMITIALILANCYALAYFYPSWGTVYPGTILLGIGRSFMATTFMYTSFLGFRYCQLTNSRVPIVLSMISGITASSFGGALLLGNAALYFILDPVLYNSTSDNAVRCSEQYCKYNHGDNISSMSFDAWRYYSLIEVFVTMALGGALFSLFIRDFSERPQNGQGNVAYNVAIVKSICLMVKDNKTYLLIPISFFIGLEEAFFLSGYTQAAASCTGAPGSSKAWFVMMMCYSSAEIVVCATYWILLKFFGRIQTLSMGIISILASFIIVILWHPSLIQIEVVIVVAVLWGVAHGLLVSVVFSLFALHSPKNLEGSFSFAAFWRCLGHLFSVLGMKYLCVHVNIYVLIAIGLGGFLCYLSFERRAR